MSMRLFDLKRTVRILSLDPRRNSQEQSRGTLTDNEFLLSTADESVTCTLFLCCLSVLSCSALSQLHTGAYRLQSLNTPPWQQGQLVTAPDTGELA